MANRKKQYIDLKGETAPNWDVVVLLSLTEIADKVLRESRLPRVEWRTGSRSTARDVRRADRFLELLRFPRRSQDRQTRSF